MNDLTWILISLVFAAGCAALGVALGRRRGPPPETHSRADTVSDVGTNEGWSIVERMTEGLVVLNPRLQPVAANLAARRLLGLPGDGLPPRLPSDEIRSVARRCVAEATVEEDIVSIWFPARRNLGVRAETLPDGAGVVVVLKDVTEELRAQRIRREFVAHASHELKSPVASMQTLAEALSQAVNDDPHAAVRFADRLVFEAGRLGRLISDLLDLSRLEDPDAVPDEIVDLGGAAERVVENAGNEIQAKHLTVKTNVGLDVLVRGDGAQLGVLVRNLVENAIRYTQDGGLVRVYVRREGDQAVVQVRDNGLGIPLEAQGRVFERFYRVDRARSRDKGGTGLGLAIVKHVAELHGGTVELESELGRGSTFTARLPAARSEKPKAQADRETG
jgi:signal transduction histidine kinase